MDLSDDDVARLLRRCASRRRALQAIRVLQRAFELFWPGAVALLVLVIAARALRLPLLWAAVALGVWLVLCVFRLVRMRHTFAPPRWFWVAYVDRHARAGGALLRRFEAPGEGADKVPQRVLDVPLELALPWRELAGISAVALAYAVCLLWPLPAAVPPQAPQLVPLPVARTQELLEQVVPHDPQAQAFVAKARQSLKALESKPGGLRRADFGALERIEKQARALIQSEAHARSQAREALATLDSLLANSPAAQGGKNEERAAGALRDAEREVRAALSAAGLEPGRFEELLQQAKRNAERQGKRARGDDNTPKPFTKDDVQALRDEIGKLREDARRSLEQGRGGVERGEGVAAIELSHDATWVDGARFDPQTFSVNQDRDTVLLSSAFSKRDEAPRADPGAQSTRSFTQGDDTEFWDKQLSPRRRALLQRYFDERPQHE